MLTDSMCIAEDGTGIPDRECTQKYDWPTPPTSTEGRSPRDLTHARLQPGKLEEVPPGAPGPHEAPDVIENGHRHSTAAGTAIHPSYTQSVGHLVPDGAKPQRPYR